MSEQMVSTPHYVSCECQHCANAIEFDGSQLLQYETRRIPCPHCGSDTEIYVPFDSEPDLIPPAPAPPIIDEQTQISLYTAVTEGAFGGILTLIGVLCCITIVGAVIGLPLIALGKRWTRKEMSRKAAVSRAENAKHIHQLEQFAKRWAAYLASDTYYAKCVNELCLDARITPSEPANFVGQVRARTEVERLLQTKRAQRTNAPNLLVVGPDGSGATTFALLAARQYAKALGTSYKVVHADKLTDLGDLLFLLQSCSPGEILFIDEIDRLKDAVRACLEAAIADFKLESHLPDASSETSRSINLPRFVLVATTKKRSALSALLGVSFPVIVELQQYSAGEIGEVTRRFANSLNMSVDTGAVDYLSSAANGNPSHAFGALTIVRHFAQTRGITGMITAEIVVAACEVLPEETPTHARENVPTAVKREVWRRDNGKCTKCGSQYKLEYDHMIPVSKGGSNTVRNIHLLCEPCNRSKSNSIQ